ncbi:hypothetical protein AGR3A_Cc180041 [Agrobacterium tomkonis CFBP 6623]|uniref:Uncharacterized protein n=1 Tax=Agrobacterium tomkonis CFBP 6623 TaxID=1183432 RepID=A0A1S7NYY0_9HYPH|nr:hypothetical protein AGR3A_Cc180041 [Agrobacterium tomkonis CFBP 6623]
MAFLRIVKPIYLFDFARFPDVKAFPLLLETL